MELSFTSKEVVAIINGGCLCTIGRGTCQLHAPSDDAGNGVTDADLSRPLRPESDE